MKPEFLSFLNLSRDFPVAAPFIKTGIFVLVAILVFVVANKLSSRLFKIPKGLSLQEVRKKLSFPLLLLILTTAVLSSFSTFEREYAMEGPFRHALVIILIGSIAWLLIRILAIIKLIVLSRYDIQEKDNLEARKVYTQFDILENILVGIIIFVALAVALMTFDSIKRIGVSLFASAGVAGIVIGLSAQRLIGTYLAGLQLAITQPIRIDDVLVVEGEWGWVEDINLTYVVVRIWDKRRLILPTTYFIEKPFQNWTRESADILGTVFLYTDYTFPVDKLREKVQELVKGHEKWDGVAANVQVTNAMERTLEVRILVSAADSPSAWDMRVYMREQLVAYIRDEFPDHLPKTRISMDGKSESENQ